MVLKDAWMRDAFRHVLLDLLLRARLAVCCSSRRVGALRVAIYATLPTWALSLIAALRGPCASCVGARRPRTGGLCAAMAAVAAEVHQSLDGHRHLAAQVTLDGEARHAFANPVEFGVGQILILREPFTPAAVRSFRARSRCRKSPSARFRMLVVGDVDACTRA
jgi:hypothetical protein